MATKASKLCSYVIQQLGKPYWYGTSGQKASESLYKKMKKAHSKYYKWSYSSSVEGQKVHDCSGLIKGVISSVAHGATSQYNSNCSSSAKAKSRDNFPYIPGTLVFKKDGSSMSHVGVFIGNFVDAKGKTHKNTIVEAKGHEWGVVISSWDAKKSNGKYSWNAWGQLKSKYCDYDTTKGQTFKASGGSSGGGSSGGVTIKTSAIDPYVAIIGPISTSIDYATLKKNKVAAMMFNAGSLFDIQHKKKTYLNPFLAGQVKKCDEQNLPYALYADVKAHNEIEADAECRALYYILDLHPPKLGIWLKLDTGQSVAMNDKIIDVYYKYIEEWGMKGRCGIYIETSKLSSFSWDKFQDKFYLLGINKSIDLKTIEGKLLQPSMFEVK
jgi:hypothetical protein